MLSLSKYQRMPLYRWSVFTRLAPLGWPGLQSCLQYLRDRFSRQHRPTFSRLHLIPILFSSHSAAAPIKGSNNQRPSSITATTSFLHLPALSERVLGLYLSKFFHPFAQRFWERFERYSLHFLPLFAGICPFRNCPLVGLYFGRSGGRYNSPYAIIYLLCRVFPIEVASAFSLSFTHATDGAPVYACLSLCFCC